jgi:hypothetical protein
VHLGHVHALLGAACDVQRFGFALMIDDYVAAVCAAAAAALRMCLQCLSSTPDDSMASGAY